MTEDENALLDIIRTIRIDRLEMQVDLYRSVIDQVRKSVPLLATEGEARENALMILSKLCDICEEMESWTKSTDIEP